MAEDLENPITPTGLLGHTGTGSVTDEVGIVSPAAARTLLNVANGATANAADASLRDRSTHTGTQATSTVSGLDAALALLAPLASPPLSGTPTAPTAAPGTSTTQLATTAFVEARAQAIAAGLAFKNSVRAATVVNGADATAFENGDTIDGVVLATGNRILRKNQTAPAENGIYTVNASGAPTRAVDADAWSELVSAFVFIEEGAVNADTSWVSTVNIGGTINSTAVTFVQFGASGAPVADGDKGDISVTGGGSTWLVDPGAITNAKRSSMAQATISGRAAAAGTGDPTDLSAAQVRTILNVEDGATADQTGAEIATAYNAQVPVVSQAVAEAGTSTAVATWTAQRVAQAIAALAEGGGGGSSPNSAANVGTPGTSLSTAEAQILSVAITPSSPTAKILVAASVYLTKDSGTTIRLATVRLRRGTTNGDPQVGGDMRARSHGTTTGVASSIYGPLTVIYVDTPGSASTQTYTVRGLVDAGNSDATAAHIVAIEIAGGASDSEAITYLAPLTGSVSRTAESKLAEVISVKDFGAIGNDSANDTAAVQAAFTAAAGTNRTVLIPNGNYKCGQLDADNVRRIICEGVIKSTITSGQTGIIIGTTGNANTDMLNGDININIHHANSSNSGLTGTIGILIKGAASCRFRSLRAQWFEVGVDIAPDAVNFQYVAFNTFEYIGTYGTLTGLRLKTSLITTNGWINENKFNFITIGSAGNSLAGTQTGVHFTGTYASNNNRFSMAHLEGLPRPIYFEHAHLNRFDQVRLETAGAIVFGDGTGTSGKVSRNRVDAGYCQDGSLPTWTHAAWAPNFVGGPDGVQWTEVAHIDYSGWSNIGTNYYHRDLCSSTNPTGKIFTNVVLTAATRSFQLAGSETGYILVPVNVGDILKVTASWTGTQTGGGTVFAAMALNAAFSALGALGAGSLPYIGTSNDSSFVNSTTTTTSFKAITLTNYPHSMFVSSNRSDVIYLSISITDDVDFKFIRVERMASRLAHGATYLHRWPDTKLLADFSTLPDFPGQIGVAGTAARVAVSTTAWAAPGVDDVGSKCGHIETVANKTYTLDLKAARAYTINSLTTDCASGSCTAAIQIDGVNVTGLSGLTVNTTETETAATAANSVAAGTTVNLVITGNSACLDLVFALKTTKA